MIAVPGVVMANGPDVKIIALKQQGKDSSRQEKQIDVLVYVLYGITADEQKIIEGQTI